MIALTGAIPGLLMQGSPAVYRANGQRVMVLCVGSVTVDVFDGAADRRVQPPLDAVALDLTHPLGLATALHYLKERGHDLAWATPWPEVVAWSVVSVSRGGKPIVGVDTSQWRRSVREPDWITRGGHGNTPLRMTEGSGWKYYGTRNPLDRWTEHGPEAGEAGQACADACALCDGYALLNPDNTLTLPTLPEPAVTVVGVVS